jgi:hypothetical protein
LNTWIKWKIQNSRRNSSIQTEGKKRSWVTKETMAILKPEEAICIIREMRKKKKKKKKKNEMIVKTVDLPFYRRSQDS